jgi:tetratricopeptide (TPR) repeat protein
VLTLELALQHYERALTQLSASLPQPPTNLPRKASPPASVPVAQVLAVLTARDHVQAILTVLSNPDAAPIPSEMLEKLSQLDHILRAQRAAIATFTDSADWRASFNPNTNAWWWFLEPPKNRWSDRYDWLWNAVSITCLTVSLGLMGDISPRFLSGSPDSLGAFTVSAQSVLTLLAAGGVLTTAGQEALKRSLKVVRLPEQYWHELGAASAFTLMLSFVAVRQSLPQIATHFYTNPGIESRRAGDWSSAEAQFQRAIKLNADDATAHFQLGNLYEDLQLPDQARPQYQLAIQGGIPGATNNLARLNILKKDYPAAISLLFKTLEQDKTQLLPVKTKHAVLKNLGWARLQQRNYPDAEKWLLEAIDLHTTATFERHEIADPHCLLAQVWEAAAKKNKNPKPTIAATDQQQIQAEWQRCLETANPTIPEQDEWLTIAQQRLSQP